jgi:signal transduction histidine kinase
VLAAVALTRRMTRPIRVLTAGTERIGAGELDQAIAVRGGGTELEKLTDEFNRMSERLRESYRTLETRVADRTQDLTASLAENSRLLLELERRTAQLEVASRHKSAFLAGTSHELRTPLNAIIGFSQVMKDGLAGEVTERQAEYLQDINDAGRHLLALINDILDLSKVEAGRMELELGPVDLEETISRATAMVRERAETGGIALAHQVEPDVGVILADGRKLRQLLLNLVDNALRFTPPGGSVEIDVRRGMGWIEIAVSDTGVGIAPEDQTVVFDEFRQIGNIGRDEGTGLGLSLCRAIARLHGGSIELESRPGQGSTFTVRIPARTAIPQVTA